jgi:hypothetical protein
MKIKFKICFSILLFSITSIGLLSFNVHQEKTRIKVNSEFSIILPTPNVDMSDLLVSLQKVNPNVIFLSSIGKSKSKPILFAVSRYEDSKNEKLDTVFYEQTVNFKANNLGEIANNYKLISHSRYKKEGKLLYTKVSSPTEGQCSVMYYFMKNNYNTVMYEIKLTGEMTEMESMKTTAEKISLSVEFY